MDVFLLNQIVRGKTLQHFCVALSPPPPLKILSKENILQDKSYHIRLNQRTKHSYFIEKEKKKELPLLQTTSDQVSGALLAF